MSKMKAQLPTDFNDPLDIEDLRQRLRFMLYETIKREFPGASKTRHSLVRAYNSLNKVKGGLTIACVIGRNMKSSDGETWAYNAWKRTVHQFMSILETPELKNEARKVLAVLKDKWAEE